MTTEKKHKSSLWLKILSITKCKLWFFDVCLAPLSLLSVRIYIGLVFLNSGLTKLPWGSASAKQLFEWEYIPNWQQNATKNLLGMDVTFPVPSVEFATLSATFFELSMSILLFMGLFTRGAAFFLFMMALTIEMFIYPGTNEHYYWMLLLGVLITHGGGFLSADYWIRRKFISPKNSLCCSRQTNKTTSD